MIARSDNVARLTTIIALVIAVFLTIVLPVAYFSFAYQYKVGNLDAEAELSAGAVQQLVMANPEMWRFEEIRLQELLQRRKLHQVPEFRAIRDAQGSIVAQMFDTISPPLIIRHHDIYDAGILVARIEISQSLVPILLRTAIAGIVSVVIGIGIFMILRTLPLRALKKADAIADASGNALRETKELLSNVLDSIEDGFIVIDRNYRILMSNRGAALWGNVMIGRYCYVALHGKQRPCYEEGQNCPVKRTFDTGEVSTAVYQHEDARGMIQLFEARSYAMFSKTGAVLSAIETIRNITDKHLLEEERLKTQKLESLGILAGGIAHDFNNLLQGVFGYISMAKMTLDQKEKSLSMLQQAEQALHMSVNLTSQLLTFSKGGKPVKKKMTLRPVIENSARFALSGSRVNCHINLEDGLLAAEADEGQISQVIQNILINADQAMPEGGSIEIAAKNVTAPDKDHPQLPKGTYIEMAIKDSGIGIPEKYREKIFDPYFTTKEKGSGLGLATSYSIIRNHGGLIDVASEPGKGTTFFIYLPAVEAGKEIKEILAASPTARKGKVLVMDDEEIILNLAGEMIKALGHEVEIAKHGEAAIEKYQSARESGNPFDIVILDLTIRGGMGGAETIERLRAIDPEVKAIVSSGYSEDAIVADYEQYGFRARLTKPYRIDGLKETLNTLLTA